MLKIVPDPPQTTDSPHALEDTLVNATEYLMCALAIALHAFSTLPKSPATMMLLTVVHELDATRTLLESALAQVQMSARAQVDTRH
ncbi:hypothetical protein N5F23_14945 [Pseudomonas sichuanensis]|uniref:hypothetical protein n=1 Tax=Pseudomonas sichuanensis TaxID=2213015 RepID=UPI002448CBF5|nr:hypothetical protein [Pseudomonas sichuanensis]MDH0731860.1 hypothetical protein [Pseudomonas sichuanensis]MDH1583874.1 hypothetical protein [Pseudomonas sichuanensis]MDH1592452.1 hypothetical protein [Pseudomonas sichuanensis]MDH1598203.1 hypothetical protein [Pseudomonas sichuanensis]